MEYLDIVVGTLMFVWILRAQNRIQDLKRDYRGVARSLDVSESEKRAQREHNLVLIQHLDRLGFYVDQNNKLRRIKKKG